ASRGWCMAEFRLLGPVQVRAAGQTLDPGPPKRCAVLAALLVDAGLPVPVDTIVDRVWGQCPPTHARSALYTHVLGIRRMLVKARKADGGEDRRVRCSVGSGVGGARDRVALHRLGRLVERARHRTEAGATRLALLREAVELWRGEPLAG